MLRRLTLENFKCFPGETTLLLSGVTLLTGVNGQGKSSALQPLLCLAQTNAFGDEARVALKGRYVDIGNLDEVRNWDRPAEHSVKVGFFFDASDGRWDPRGRILSLTAGARTGTAEVDTLTAMQVAGDSWVASRTYSRDPGVGGDHAVLELLNALDDDVRSASASIRYVAADRVAPRAFVPLTALPERPSVGRDGSLVFEALRAVVDADHTLPPGRCAPESQEAGTVADQAAAWLHWVFGAAGMKITGIEDLGYRPVFNSDGGVRYVRARDPEARYRGRGEKNDPVIVLLRVVVEIPGGATGWDSLRATGAGQRPGRVGRGGRRV